MKKSELKELLKVIVQEVAEIKKAQLDETKGLSGFKKSKDSTEHTEKVADSKDLTGKTEPKEKEEGKKLPIVKKPANPQKVGSIKEEILGMIREAIQEADLSEMAKQPVSYDGKTLSGGIKREYRSEDPKSPTGWSLNVPYKMKDGTVVPVGTPVDAPKIYDPKGTNPNMGRPKKTQAVEPAGVVKKTTNQETIQAIEDILAFSKSATDAQIKDELKQRKEAGENLNVDDSFLTMQISKIRNAESGIVPASTDSPEATEDPAAIDATVARIDKQIANLKQRKDQVVKSKFAAWRAQQKAKQQGK